MALYDETLRHLMAWTEQAEVVNCLEQSIVRGHVPVPVDVSPTPYQAPRTSYARPGVPVSDFDRGFPSVLRPVETQLDRFGRDTLQYTRQVEQDVRDSTRIYNAQPNWLRSAIRLAATEVRDTPVSRLPEAARPVQKQVRSPHIQELGAWRPTVRVPQPYTAPQAPDPEPVKVLPLLDPHALEAFRQWFYHVKPFNTYGNVFSQMSDNVYRNWDRIHWPSVLICLGTQFSVDYAYGRLGQGAGKLMRCVNPNRPVGFQAGPSL